jgi:hypothetical protein
VRRLLTLSAALSLLACVATVALWVRSARLADALFRTSVKRPPAQGYDDYALWSSAGLLVWQREDVTPSPDDLRVMGEAIVGMEEEGWHYVGPQPAFPFYQDEDRWLAINVGWSSYHPPRTGFFTEPPAPADNVWRTSSSVWFPHWMLAAATAVLPAFVIGRALIAVRRRKARSRAGACANCGYDLRATVGRCPECGTTAPSEPGTRPVG